MTAVELPSTMSPAQLQGWAVLLDVAEAFPTGWCLVGGQMVWLLAAEHDTHPPRATEDVDVVVDVRAEPNGIQDLCNWLEKQRGFDLEGISPEGIGHRYIKAAEPGPGRIIFDVLAPENVGRRANLSTTRGARTLEAPGTRIALNNAERVEVTVGSRNGWVYRPRLLSAIIAKAVSTTIPTRSNERDFRDAAFLLSLVQDPVAAAQGLSRPERVRLSAINSLLDSQHEAWRPLGPERARLGHTTIEFLLA
jgi:hypothetical protein